MTEVKHFDDVLILADSVVNNNRAMLQFSHSVTLSDRTTHAGKPGEQTHVVEQSIAKPRGSLAIVFGNAADNFGEIV
jgi:hypothetical protein